MHYLLLNSVVHVQRETWENMLQNYHFWIHCTALLFQCKPFTDLYRFDQQYGVVESWKCCSVQLYKIWLKVQLCLNWCTNISDLQHCVHDLKQKYWKLFSKNKIDCKCKHVENLVLFQSKAIAFKCMKTM